MVQGSDSDRCTQEVHADALRDSATLVRRIQAGDQEGMSELYRVFGRGVRFFLRRRFWRQELDDQVHDVFLVVIEAIKRGDLREPERLMGFVRTILRRQISNWAGEVAETRRDYSDVETGPPLVDHTADPEQRVIEQQQERLMAEVLRQLPPREREVLTRFYLYEQTPQQICDELGLTETQFRLVKSRGKARFATLGRRKLQRSLTSLAGREAQP